MNTTVLSPSDVRPPDSAGGTVVIDAGGEMFVLRARVHVVVSGEELKSPEQTRLLANHVVDSLLATVRARSAGGSRA